MIIYNTKVICIVESEHVCTSHLPWLCQDVLMYYVDMHFRMFVAVCIVSTFISMPVISVPLFSVWLGLESQSAMKISGPGLYNILTQNWHILRRICCILCDSVAVPFLNITTSGL